jgi:hypothetical protein
VLTVQTGVVLATGELWLYLLQFPLGNFAMCVVFAQTAGGPNPLVARLAAEVVALRQPATHHPGLQPTSATACLRVRRSPGNRRRVCQPVPTLMFMTGS